MSLIPRAHLLMVLNVAGATSTASPRGSAFASSGPRGLGADRMAGQFGQVDGQPVECGGGSDDRDVPAGVLGSTDDGGRCSTGGRRTTDNQVENVARRRTEAGHRRRDSADYSGPLREGSKAREGGSLLAPETVAEQFTGGDVVVEDFGGDAFGFDE